MSTQIHWFPGHMKKAQIEIEKKVKLVDCVIELLDARIPLASRNETLYKITENKLRLVVLTKSDLADPEMTKKWANYFEYKGSAVIFADLNKSSDIQNIIKNVEKLGEAKQQKLISKGMKPQPIRAMIIGIPNVGKSTLINKLAKCHSASLKRYKLPKARFTGPTFAPHFVGMITAKRFIERFVDISALLYKRFEQICFCVFLKINIYPNSLSRRNPPLRRI